MMTTLSSLSASPTAQRPHAIRTWLSAVPWMTVLPLAAVMAFADGFWMTSLRGATGSIERNQTPFVSWLRESTLSLPVFAIAVAAALMLAASLFGPVLGRAKTVVAAALIVVAAGTLVGVFEIVASAAYDYRLQTSQTMAMDSMASSPSAVGTTSQNQATFGLQAHSVGVGSGLILVTNIALVGWVVAMRGGRLKVSTTQH
ncbi:MAG: hypothetical protein ABI903_09480 [Actinomycetota bacterium]